MLDQLSGGRVARGRSRHLAVRAPDLRPRRRHFVRYAAEGTIDHLVVNVPFGDMVRDEARRTLDGFVEEVMPAVRAASSPYARTGWPPRTSTRSGAPRSPG